MKNKEIIIGGVSKKQLLVFAKQLHAAVRAGFPLNEALRFAQKQSAGRLKQLLPAITHEVDKGLYLHESLSKYPQYFPALFLNLIKTGELSGSLEESLLRLSEVLKNEIDFDQKVRSAMVYPIFVLITLIILAVSVVVFILPNILPLFSSLDVELPLTTRMLLAISTFFSVYGKWVWIGLATLAVVLPFVARRSFMKPFNHYLVLHFPVVGALNRKIFAARMSQTLKSLLASGIPLSQSVEISTSILDNYYYQKALRESIPNLRKGQLFSQALQGYPALFDDTFLSLLESGERTGGLEDSLEYLYEFYSEEVDDSMKNLAVSMEPFLLIVVGLMVAFVAMAIIGPIYSITGSLR